MALAQNWLRKILLCSMLALAPGAMAWACAICAPSAAEQTLTQRLYKSEAVAIARALPQAGRFELLATVRGERPTVQSAQVQAHGNGTLPGPGTTVVLAYTGGAWNVVGALPQDRAAWLEKLIALRRPADANPLAPDANWPARFAFFQPDLENPNELVAQAAYDELSSAPYAALRAAARSLPSAARPRRWLAVTEVPRTGKGEPDRAAVARVAGRAR